ncbi:MAG: hypothetical protein HY055_10820 [Magnetospirillum sp.]|nr:hypothetical protein [Magnetospirillum sp.]
MKTIVTTLAVILAVSLSGAPAFAQMGQVPLVVQPSQTGAITGGASNAVNPRLDASKAPADAKAEPKTDTAPAGKPEPKPDDSGKK